MARRCSSEDWTGDFDDVAATRTNPHESKSDIKDYTSGSINSLATNNSSSDFGSDFGEDAAQKLSDAVHKTGLGNHPAVEPPKPVFPRLSSNSTRPMSLVDIADFEWDSDDNGDAPHSVQSALTVHSTPSAENADQLDLASKGGRRASQYDARSLSTVVTAALAASNAPSTLNSDALSGEADRVSEHPGEGGTNGDAGGSDVSDGADDDGEDWDAELGIDTTAMRSTLRAMLSPAAGADVDSSAASSPGHADQGVPTPFGQIRDCDRLFHMLVPQGDDQRGLSLPSTPSFQLPRVSLVVNYDKGTCTVHVAPTQSANGGSVFADMEEQCDWVYRLASRIAGDATASHMAPSGSGQWSTSGREDASSPSSRQQSRRSSRVAGIATARRQMQQHVSGLVKQQLDQQKEAVFERRIASSSRMSVAWVDAHVAYCDHLMVVGAGDQCVAVAQRLVTQVKEAASVAIAAGASSSSAVPEHCRQGALAALRLVARSWSPSRDARFVALCESVSSIMSSGKAVVQELVALLTTECRAHYGRSSSWAEVEPRLLELAGRLHVWALALEAGDDTVQRHVIDASDDDLAVSADTLADIQLILHSCSPLTCSPTSTGDGASASVSAALHSGTESAPSSRTNSGNHDLQAQTQRPRDSTPAATTTTPSRGGGSSQSSQMLGLPEGGAGSDERVPGQRKSRVIDMGDDGGRLLRDADARSSVLGAMYARLPIHSLVKAKVAYALAMHAWHDLGDVERAEVLFLESARICECVLEALSPGPLVAGGDVLLHAHRSASASSIGAELSGETSAAGDTAAVCTTGSQNTYKTTTLVCKGSLSAHGLSQSLVAEVASNAVAGLGEVLMSRNAYLPAVRSLEASLVAGRRGMTAAQRYARVRWLAGVCSARSDLWRALRLYSRVLRQVRADGRENEATHVALVVADAYADVGNHRDAEVCLLEALAFLNATPAQRVDGNNFSMSPPPQSGLDAAGVGLTGRPNPLRQMLQLRLARLHAEGFDLDGGIAALETWLLSPNAQAPSSRTAALKSMLAASYAKKRWFSQTLSILAPPSFTMAPGSGGADGGNTAPASLHAVEGGVDRSHSDPAKLRSSLRARSTSMPHPMPEEGRERTVSDPTKGAVYGPPQSNTLQHQQQQQQQQQYSAEEPRRIRHSPSFFFAAFEGSADMSAGATTVTPGGVALSRVASASTTGLGYWRMAATVHLRDGSPALAIACIEYGMLSVARGAIGGSVSVRDCVALLPSLPGTTRAEVDLLRAKALASVVVHAPADAFPWKIPALDSCSDTDANGDGDAGGSVLVSGRLFSSRYEVLRDCARHFSSAIALFAAGGNVVASSKARVAMTAALLDHAVSRHVLGGCPVESVAFRTGDGGTAPFIVCRPPPSSFPAGSETPTTDPDGTCISLDDIERCARDALDAASALYYPLLIISAQLCLAEVRVLSGAVEEARAFWKESRDCFLALYGTAPAHEPPTPASAPPGHVERLFTIASRLVRLHLRLSPCAPGPADGTKQPDPLTSDPMLIDSFLRLQSGSEVAPRRRNVDGKLATPPMSSTSTVSTQSASTRVVSPDESRDTHAGHSLSAGPSASAVNGVNPLPSYSTFPPAMSRQKPQRAAAASVFARDSTDDIPSVADDRNANDSRKYSQQTLKVYSPSRNGAGAVEGSALSAIAQSLGATRSDEDLLSLKPTPRGPAQRQQQRRAGALGDGVGDAVFACETRMRRALKRYAVGELSAEDLRRTCREATEDMVSVTAAARRDLEDVLSSDVAVADRLAAASLDHAAVGAGDPSASAPLSRTLVVMSLFSHIVAVGPHVSSNGWSSRHLCGIDDGRMRVDTDGSRKSEMQFKSKLSLKLFADGKSKKAATISGTGDLAGLQSGRGGRRSKLPDAPHADTEGRLSRELCDFVTELVARPRELYGSRRAKLRKQRMDSASTDGDGGFGDASVQFALSNFCHVAAPWVSHVISALVPPLRTDSEAPTPTSGATTATATTAEVAGGDGGGDAQSRARLPHRSQAFADHSNSGTSKRRSIFGFFGVSAGGASEASMGQTGPPLPAHPLLFVCSRALHAFPWEMVLSADGMPPLVRGFSLCASLSSERDRQRRALQYASQKSTRPPTDVAEEDAGSNPGGQPPAGDADSALQQSPRLGGDLRLPEFFAPAYSLESREARKGAERARRGYLLRDLWVRVGIVDHCLERSRYSMSNRPFQSSLVKSLKSKPRAPKFLHFLDLSLVGDTPEDLVRGIIFGLGKGCYPVFLCTFADLLEMGECLTTILGDLNQCVVVAVPSSRMKDFARILGKTQEMLSKGSRKGLKGALALVKNPYQYLFHVLGDIQRQLRIPIAVFNAP